jgi:hypothetical protein
LESFPERPAQCHDLGHADRSRSYNALRLDAQPRRLRLAITERPGWLSYSHAHCYSYCHRYSYTSDFTDTDTDCDSHGHCDSRDFADAYSYRNGNAGNFTNTDRRGYSYCHRNGDGDRDSYAG